MPDLYPAQTTVAFGPRRGQLIHVSSAHAHLPPPTSLGALEELDLIYRTLCGLLYNYVPQSGHPGGSISSGRIAQALVFGPMAYDLAQPDSEEADILSYAAGHKAMGLYALCALRNECARICRPALLAPEARQLRLEDLLGFRRNPVTDTPLFKRHRAKTLDGHPTPATPLVRLSTGASGVGVASSIGYALAALDFYGKAAAPMVHILEGEGGLTPGRVVEALATAAAAQARNVVLHLDFNQASIDSNRVCREGALPGDYVQWSPAELFYLHDWNVITVENGHDFAQVCAAQRLALIQPNEQPTAVIYRTTKGWQYGIEGRNSHGAGHVFCSEAFYQFLAPFEQRFACQFPRFSGQKTAAAIEQAFFDSLMLIRQVLESADGQKRITGPLADQLYAARVRLQNAARQPRPAAPRLEVLTPALLDPQVVPPELVLKPGASVTLRGMLGQVCNYLNKQTGGAFLASSADLLESTSVSHLNQGFPPGFFAASANPGSRLLSTGGICEDGMGGVLTGVSAFGRHIGVGSSYCAFIAPLQHIAARLHAIGQQSRLQSTARPPTPYIMVCAHAGPKTGEDGPTHADPQALQLLQENFPKGSAIALTPWDAREIWPLLAAALRAAPALISVFVTRPTELVNDRAQFRLAPAALAAQGLYALRQPRNACGTVVLQGNGVTANFVTGVLPELDQRGLELNVFYVASAELFDNLSAEQQEAIYPERLAREAMGITEFTLPTLDRWILSRRGREHSLHPFKAGHYLGSGQAERVFEEAQLDAGSQLAAILQYLKGDA